ncbi:Lj965 prophage protein [Mycoavidus cysteinexigens]|uniref:Lj965 prophage protein n=1 Tax=Mycoavidus cysteinexigens TaxID=1553431 RepID=A0A2Z6EVY5_9BURK|nr:DUF1828 domain-containing protein [Mycoavidus cysteinexigens]BBE09572.1 Lj965 prophage protein [Mycoavidus cysteinexigens]GAM51663.1 lj965 prophage protein [bacterium endosymbiont of Mortierella elongata FMR23-6]GLR01046.1 hypothetical protein GCM10007934_08580 [Mycoavidus cysteinexigens]
MSFSNDLVNGYYEWLKCKTTWRKIGDWVEITTPYLDRHNDYIQIYLRQQDNGWILTDDGYTLNDLAQSGCHIDTPHRKRLLETLLKGFSVVQVSNCLEVRTDEENFAARTHDLIQAILAVNHFF